MTSLMKISLILLALGSLAACTTRLSEQDRALINSANENAQAAKQQAAQALQEAQAARASANTAAANASSANEKSDRMFQRSLRK